jgi:hypothetical protein
MAHAGDRPSVQRAATRERAARKSELDQIRFLMREPIGRRLAQRLLDATGADRQPTFSPNAMTLAHDHGVRELGFFLLSEIREACPEQELVMRQETISLARRADLQDEVDDANRNKPD